MQNCMNFSHGGCFISVTMATIFSSNTYFCQDVEPNNILIVEFIVIKDRHKKLNLVWTPSSNVRMLKLKCSHALMCLKISESVDVVCSLSLV